MNSFASPVNYKIGFPYTLKVKGSGLQTQNIITVTTHAGDPVEGAEIDFTDTNGPQTYVTVTAEGSNIYTSADSSSAVLLAAEKRAIFRRNRKYNRICKSVYARWNQDRLHTIR